MQKEHLKLKISDICNCQVFEPLANAARRKNHCATFHMKIISVRIPEILVYVAPRAAFDTGSYVGCLCSRICLLSDVFVNLCVFLAFADTGSILIASIRSFYIVQIKRPTYPFTIKQSVMRTTEI